MSWEAAWLGQDVVCVLWAGDGVAIVEVVNGYRFPCGLRLHVSSALLRQAPAPVALPTRGPELAPLELDSNGRPQLPPWGIFVRFAYCGTEIVAEATGEWLMDFIEGVLAGYVRELHRLFDAHSHACNLEAWRLFQRELRPLIERFPAVWERLGAEDRELVMGWVAGEQRRRSVPAARSADDVAPGEFASV